MSERIVEPFGDDLDREVPNAQRIHKARRQERIPMGEDDSVSPTASKMPDGLVELPDECVAIEFEYSDELLIPITQVRLQILMNFGIHEVEILDPFTIRFAIDRKKVDTFLNKLRIIWSANPPMRTHFVTE